MYNPFAATATEYLCVAPYVRERPLKHFDPATALAWTASDREDVERLYAAIAAWALANGYLEPAGENRHLPMLEGDGMASLAPAVFDINFRALVGEENFKRLMGHLEDTSADSATEALVQFAIHLTKRFDQGFLTRFITKTYYALDAYTPPPARTRRTVPWAAMHRRAPFLWVLHALQEVMHATVANVDPRDR